LLSDETTEQPETAVSPSFPVHLIRKSPQPYRSARNPNSGLRSL
jgi:hypothetical protein